MEDILNVETNRENNNIEILNKPKKLLLELLNIYSYKDVMNCLLTDDMSENNIHLEIKLKELVDKVDIMELAQLLMSEEIIQYTNNNLLDIENNSTKKEEILTNLDNSLKLENDIDKKEIKIKTRKKKEKPKPILSKILYKNNGNIYIYRYLTSKKGNMVSLRCQDKSCKSKAFYNFISKEINIYEKHSIPIEQHSYLNDRTSENIKNLVNFMNEKPEIKYLEIYSDSTKKIIENISKINTNKKIFNINQVDNETSLLNHKRYNSIKFSLLKYKKKKISQLKISKIKNNKIIFSIETKNEPVIEKEVKEKEEILDVNENNEAHKNFNLNDKEIYLEIKDKYLKHNKLLTEIEQKYFGKNKRLGTHFHKNEKGEIYNYFGNNKEIKDNKMNYRCTLKGCKGRAVYNLEKKEFIILREHNKPYENHSCYNHNSDKAKHMIEYLKNNQNINDLQLILK